MIASEWDGLRYFKWMPFEARTIRGERKKIVVRSEVDLEKVREGGRYHVHSWEERKWRYLATMQFETIIEARVPRMEDRGRGTTHLVATPWAEEGRKWTLAPYGKCARPTPHGPISNKSASTNSSPGTASSQESSPCSRPWQGKSKRFQLMVYFRAMATPHQAYFPLFRS
jgi:hypothetical protein